MPPRLYLYYLMTFVILNSCKKQESDLTDGDEKLYGITGNVQKGPFVNGSGISIYELDNKFKPSGRTFHTTTESCGQFELIDISLISPYVELVADGFYYDEIAGRLSNERLSLKALVDLSEQDNVNINVLTNLEYNRVKQLISSEGLTIQEAKDQAIEEILRIFKLDSFAIGNPESLDILNSGEGDAILLAVSAIIQGNQTTAELSKLLADIVTDINDDGSLDDTLIQNTLLGQALTLNTDLIKQNLIEKYEELGININQINNFDEYIEYFIMTIGNHE